MLKKITDGVLIRIIGMFLTLVSGLLLARLLGVEKYGIYSFILSVSTLMAIPVECGLANLIIREGSRLNNNNDRVLSLKNWCIKRSIIISGVVFSISITFIVITNKERVDFCLYVIGFTSIFFTSLSLIHYSFLKAFGALNLAQLSEAVIYPFFLTNMVMVLYLFGESNLYSSVFARMFSLAVMLLVSFLLLKKFLPNGVKIKDTYNYDDKRILNLKLWPLMISDGIRVAQGHIFIVIISVMLTSYDAGVFRVAQSLYLFALIPSTVIVTIISPKIASMFNNDRCKLNNIISNYSIVNSLILLLGFIVTYFISDYIIDFIFGNEYSQAYNILCIFIFGALLSSVFGYGEVVLNMVDEARLVVKASIFTFVFSLVLSYFLIVEYGLIGATYSYVIMMILQKAVLNIIAKVKLKIKVSYF